MYPCTKKRYAFRFARIYIGAYLVCLYACMYACMYERALCYVRDDSVNGKSKWSTPCYDSIIIVFL